MPRLGPPLPGDLGRSILERQRSLKAEGPATSPDAAAAAEAERQRLEAARSSAVLVQLGGSQTGGAAVPTGQPAPSPFDPAAAVTAAPAGGGAARVSAFGRAEVPSISPHRLVEPPSPWTLAAGTIIPASLITGLNSDLPGTVLAQVTENVRDSATGRAVLIPQGARLIGTYDNVVGFGQRRALLVWQRILFPDGASVGLDNVPAADVAGYSGLEDEVDFHTWRLLTGIGLSTLLGVGTELSLGDDESDLVRALRESGQQNAARAGDRITSRNLDMQPTLTVRPGWPVRAVLHRDLVLRPWRGELR